MLLGSSKITERILREDKHINQRKFPAKTFAENKRRYETISGARTMLLSSFSKK